MGQPVQSTVDLRRLQLVQSLQMYDAMTGNYILTITMFHFAACVPGNVLSLTADENGNLIGYYVNSTVA